MAAAAAASEGVPWIQDLGLAGFDPEPYRNRLEHLDAEFVKRFGSRPRFFARAPGRVNLIGEHIDYEGYSVLPMAISQDTIIAIRRIPSEDSNGTIPSIKISNVRSSIYPDYEFAANPEQEVDVEKHCWANYFLCGYKGVFDYLKNNNLPSNFKCGFEVMVDGIVPTGAGLSSSAALVCSSFISVMKALDLSFSKTIIAENCCICERYIGTQSGGMDQAISIMARPGYAKLIDFHPLREKDVVLPQDALFVISNSCTVSNKAESASKHYNYRVLECTLASMVLAIKLGMKEDDAVAKTHFTLKELQSFAVQSWKQKGLGVLSIETIVQENLHDEPYTEEELATLLHHSLNEIFHNSKASLSVLKIAKEFKLKQRALHVYSESNRVISFHDVANSLHDSTGSLSSDDILKKLGTLMNESHQSCSKLYECSCPELDHLVSICLSYGALGSRLTGAGWGGCVVSLIPKHEAQNFIASVKEKYYKPLVIQGSIKEEKLNEYIFATKPSSGAAIFPPFI